MVDVVQARPPDRVDIVARLGLALDVLRGDLDQGIVVFDPVLIVAVDAIDDGDDLVGADGQPGLFEDFADRRLADGLAQFLAAARQAPFALARGLATLDQQYLIAAPHDDADTNQRALRIGPRPGTGRRRLRVIHGGCLLSTAHR